ncbi:Tetratricopeptide repeat [Trinorchestia longiramus]|nr:Tetratricopeptide repeat [Trinorchestia longiramus]
MAEDKTLLPWTDPRVNNHIVSSTINYYGHGLLKQLADTKRHLLPYPAMKDINYQSFKARAHKLREPDEVKLYTTSVDFILNNADFLFSQPISKSMRAEDPSKYGFKDKYKNLPPLEYYLQANKKMRTVQFHKDLRRGDLLVCRAMQSTRGSKYQPLRVVFRDAGPHMFCGKNLFLNVNLDISQTRVPEVDEGSVPNTWTINTLVRVEVLSVTSEAGYEKANIIVGTMGDTLLENNRLDMSLGKVNRSDVPESINAMESYTKESIGSYDANMKKLDSFKNPRCVQHLSNQLNLSIKNTSLMSTLRNEFTAPSRYKQLRRLQLTRWAHKHVADGVTHFKKGEHAEAFQLLSKALSIDAENVEAYVAKGALLANMGSFEKAVEDFESALKYNPEHSNARKYICETLLELGKRYEEEGKLGAAEGCFVRAVQVNAEHSSSLKALARLHTCAGFKSLVAVEVLKKKEKDEEKKELQAPTQNKAAKTVASSDEEESKVTIISDEEISLPPNKKLKKPRERSLSPLAQKLAMQNNAWKPPDYINTTNSYLQDIPPQPETMSAVAQIKRNVSVMQTKPYIDASAGEADVRALNTNTETATTSSYMTTPANKTLNQASSSKSDTYSSGSKSKVHPSTTDASVPSTKFAVQDFQKRKESASITPFIVGANQSAAAAAATAAATAPDGKIDQVSSVLVVQGTSKKVVSVPSVVSSIDQSLPVTQASFAVSTPVSSIGTVAATVLSSDTSCSTRTVSSVLPGLTVNTNSATVVATTSDKSPVYEDAVLDRNYENVMEMEPINSDEIEVLSSTLIMLSSKYRAAGNKERARLCVERSLKHNPEHEPSLLALQKLTHSSPTPGAQSCYQNTEGILPSNAPVSCQPISVVPPYPGPPAAEGFPRFSVPPPNFIVPPPSQPGMTYPPMRAGDYGLPFGAPPNLTEPPPGYGKWGTAVVGSAEASAGPSQLTQEDKDYHEKVDSFLKHIMERNRSKRSESSSYSSSSSRSSSSESPRSSRRRSSRASSSGKSRSRRERYSSHSKSPGHRRERWNADVHEGREFRDDWKNKSRDGRPRSQDPLSPSRSRLPQLRDGPPPSLGRPSPSRNEPRDRPSRSWKQRSRDRRSESRRSSSSSSQSGSPQPQKKKNKEKKKQRASSSKNQVLPPEGRLGKSSSAFAIRDTSKSRSRDDTHESRGRTTKKCYREGKKKKSHRRSSSSGSSSNSSSSSSSLSSGHAKRKKKKKSKKQQSISKLDLKSIGLANDPVLESIDKELLRKISEKLYQSNVVLEAKDVGKKKKKKKKKKKRKRSRESDKSDSEGEKEKKRKNKGIREKSVEKNIEKRKRKNSEMVSNSEEASVKEKSREAFIINKYGKKGEHRDEDTVAKKKKEEEQMGLLEKEQLKEITQKYLLNTTKESAVSSIEEDKHKLINEEEPKASFQRLMKLPGLEDLQKKLRNYYNKCENKTVEPSESEDLLSRKLKSSNNLVKQTTSFQLSTSTCSSKRSSPSKPGGVLSKSIAKHETKSSSSVLPETTEVVPSSSSPGKSDVNARVPSVFKSAVQSVITQSKQEPLLPMGPATPELLKRRPSLESVAPPSAATLSTITDPTSDTTSRFKSTFQPVSSAGLRPSIFKMGLILPDGSIMTPSEFKAGMWSKAKEKMDALLDKAQDVAENISKLKENTRQDDKKLNPKLASSTPLDNRSRSRSKSRGRTSQSRSRQSRSRSLDRRRRSRSRSFDRPRRSRSRSFDRPRRSRSRSLDRPLRSRSRSLDRPRRSRSRSLDRRRQFRSPFRGGYRGYRDRGRFQGRYQHGHTGRYQRGGFNY